MIKWYKCTKEKPKRGEIILYSPIWKTLELAYFNNRSKDKSVFYVDLIQEELNDREWECHAPDYYWAYAKDFNFPSEVKGE